MADLPYPFSKGIGPKHHYVALGNGEYVSVVLAGDYAEEIERSCAWGLVAMRLMAQLYPDVPWADRRAECDRLFIKALDDV